MSQVQEFCRKDIDGLRAIAILAVVSYLVGLPGVHGGFVGVDVFFVISGYLITSLLLAEAQRDGSVSLRSLYARRIRRLFPALFVELSASYRQTAAPDPTQMLRKPSSESAQS
jgi:peptidoglycan/LPS O-acetylase OafA/YrhL